MQSFLYLVVFIVSFFFISLLAVKSSGKVKTGSDFSLANRSLNSAGVSWVIIGTLVGGVSTIGTVQTAYTHGLSAWIFTLGSGISCFLLGCFFAKALREEGVVTVSEYLGNYFGKNFRYYSSAFNSTGMFIHIVGQFLAAMAILQSVFAFSYTTSVFITMALIAVFVVSGGIAGAGTVGKIKFYMLYIIMFISAMVSLYKGGGISEILSRLPQDKNMLSLFSYGTKTAVLDMTSMLVGVLSTQIYLQAIFSAKDVKEARNGAFLSAVIIPPIGILGIIIGLYLRAYFPEVAANSAQAFPFFLNHTFPPLISAFFSAGILLIVLGTGTGLVLGVTTNIYTDFISKISLISDKISALMLLRLCGLFILFLSSCIVFSGLDSTILKWSYMSMGLRGSSIFAGLWVLSFMKSYKNSKLLHFFLYMIPPIYILFNVA
ncbi:sodium:solute symporter family protein [Desulfonema magnum]|uniref:Na+/solute symporter n=1 Tax=Desulfonema magnum TaxID=45655 RepID=A0A975BTX6_9BACT|nr:sodium:solute symporter family protein [Desulfonema magnum]QTA91745.1 Putative Na+/solute symporter [Desulfonema magnum]